MADQPSNPSSAASAPVAGAQAQAKHAINSDDPAWSHCYCPDITKRQSLKCNYCDKLCSGGITRIKYHLAGMKGFNTTKCLKVPPPVQQEMFALLTKKTSEKEEKAKEKERERAEVDIDHSDCGSGSEDSEHGDVVLVVKQGSFGHEIATRQRKNKNFNPAKWWLHHGTSTPNLRKLAARILSLTCSSSACERNWSVFEQVHTKKRNRLLHERMRDLVFVKFNSKLRNKREKKDRDPLEKEVDDVVADGDNEFITGIMPSPSEMEQQQCAQESQQHTSQQAQAQAKRKRPVRSKKRKVRSLQSLMRNGPVQPEAPSSDSEDCDDGISMQTTDSDKSPSPSSYA